MFLMSVASLAGTLIVTVVVGISYHICIYVPSKNKGKEKNENNNKITETGDWNLQELTSLNVCVTVNLHYGTSLKNQFEKTCRPEIGIFDDIYPFLCIKCDNDWLGEPSAKEYVSLLL